MKTYATLEDLRAQVGQIIGTSEWIEIRQDRVQQFADATGDHQWIHLDAERAKTGPFGATIAHGFLTLSLLPHLSASAYQVEHIAMGVNYGLNRVRFTSPVRVGARVRGQFKLAAFDPIEGGAQLTTEVTIEIEGASKPACIAESLIRLYPPAPAPPPAK